MKCRQCSSVMETFRPQSVGGEPIVLMNPYRKVDIIGFVCPNCGEVVFKDEKKVESYD